LGRIDLAQFNLHIGQIGRLAFQEAAIGLAQELLLQPMRVQVGLDPIEDGRFALDDPVGLGQELLQFRIDGHQEQAGQRVNRKRGHVGHADFSTAAWR